jgi:hypothetical protein
MIDETEPSDLPELVRAIAREQLPRDAVSIANAYAHAGHPSRRRAASTTARAHGEREHADDPRTNVAIGTNPRRGLEPLRRELEMSPRNVDMRDRRVAAASETRPTMDRRVSRTTRRGADPRRVLQSWGTTLDRESCAARDAAESI